MYVCMCVYSLPYRTFIRMFRFSHIYVRTLRSRLTKTGKTSLSTPYPCKRKLMQMSAVLPVYSTLMLQNVLVMLVIMVSMQLVAMLLMNLPHFFLFLYFSCNEWNYGDLAMMEYGKFASSYNISFKMWRASFCGLAAGKRTSASLHSRLASNRGRNQSSVGRAKLLLLCNVALPSSTSAGAVVGEVLRGDLWEIHDGFSLQYAPE